jgi:nucleoid-associated protein YgaU
MKMRTGLRIVLMLGCLGAANGCTTLVAQRRAEAQRRESETDRAAAEVAKLKERVEALTVCQQQIDQQMGMLQTESREESARLRQSVADVERELKALREAQKSERQELVDQMVKRVAEVRAQPAGAAPRVERGYEHVVKAGQTLSEIAAAYKVRPQDIIKANKLESPNALRVGQKLFIPE